MRKKRVTQGQKIEAEKAALRRRIEDMLAVASGAGAVELHEDEDEYRWVVIR